MRTIIIALSILISTSTYSQKAEYFKNNKYSGYIFPQEFDVLLSIENQSGRFTPYESTIKTFECNLSKKLAELAKDLPDQGKGCPSIEKKRLNKYKRQYFGFINQNGDKILFVNFVWSKSNQIIIDKLSKDLVSVHDGCTRYWSIQYNLTKNEFYDLDVNTRS